jgi:hypothetical protein
VLSAIYHLSGEKNGKKIGMMSSIVLKDALEIKN